jgi:hypothetical protein
MALRLRQHLYGLVLFLLAVSSGVALTQLNRHLRSSVASIEMPSIPATNIVSSLPEQLRREPNSEERPADYFFDAVLRYNGYTIEPIVRRARLDYPDETQAKDRVDVSYMAIKRNGRLVKKFDAGIYFGMGGNSARAGFFPFLGGTTQQVFISQDVNRGGCQWIVSLSPRFCVIFDGRKFGVGREAYDLSAIDLDNDGIYEIVAPITDFYGLQDKMSISQIPLPSIVFKYDPKKEEYLPANPRFQDYVLKGLTDLNDVSTGDDFEHRSVILERLLALIYAGKRKEAWDYFDRCYSLQDKKDLKLRVKTILKGQPVYDFIYNTK